MEIDDQGKGGADPEKEGDAGTCSEERAVQERDEARGVESVATESQLHPPWPARPPPEARCRPMAPAEAHAKDAWGQLQAISPADARSHSIEHIACVSAPCDKNPLRSLPFPVPSPRSIPTQFSSAQPFLHQGKRKK